jgi:hypothetical protein
MGFMVPVVDFLSAFIYLKMARIVPTGVMLTIAFAIFNWTRIQSVVPKLLGPFSCAVMLAIGCGFLLGKLYEKFRHLSIALVSVQ